MNKLIFSFLSLISIPVVSFCQKNLTVDANDVLTSNSKIVINTGNGQSFFTGHQIGSGYSYPGGGIFRAITDNPYGPTNYFFEGLTNGTTNYSVRADGQGYFAGNVGIGTANPSAKLSIFGSNTSSSTNTPAITDFYGVYDRTRMALGNTSITPGGSRSSAILFYSKDGTGTALRNNWEIGNDLDMNGNNDFYFYSASINQATLYLASSGDVGIGTTNPRGYKLAVAGKAIAEEVTVKLQSSWPDYVFKKDYHLPSLIDVKIYIDKNQHLPDMPSE